MAHRAGARVLVVEEDSSAARYLTCLLERAGLPCYVARDGDEAAAALGGFTIDLLLVNAHLTGTDSLELVRAASSLPRAPAVVVLTTEATPQLRRRVRTAGAGHLIELPLSPRELVSRLRHLLGSVASASAAAARVSSSARSPHLLDLSRSAATLTARRSLLPNELVYGEDALFGQETIAHVAGGRSSLEPHQVRLRFVSDSGPDTTVRTGAEGGA